MVIRFIYSHHNFLQIFLVNCQSSIVQEARVHQPPFRYHDRVLSHDVTIWTRAILEALEVDTAVGPQ